MNKKKIQYNHQVFMGKTLRKAIMNRSKLRNTFSKKDLPITGKIINGSIISVRIY